MLQLFSNTGTVDDLGIGTVRDAISNALFPGTSVIQTRARYFLFIPWLFQRAERDYPQRLIAKATDMERNLVEALRVGGDLEGLIGREAGKNVRTLPSAIFWGGLIRYGIFLVPSLSITQYGRQVGRGISAADTEDEIGDRLPSFWQREVPDPPRDFFHFRSATFELARDEAEWLCERIVSSDRPYKQPSMLTACIRDIRRGNAPLAVNAIWDAELPADTAAPIVRLVYHAQQLSCAAQGAALLYNLILAEERSKTIESAESTSPATYSLQIDKWIADAIRLHLAKWAVRTDEFWSCLLDFGAAIPPSTRLFIDDWSKLIAADPGRIASSPRARELIRARELQHKRGQARLINKERLTAWTGYAGTTPLSFRWPQVQRMLRDIGAGLGSHVVGADDAVA